MEASKTRPVHRTYGPVIRRNVSKARSTRATFSNSMRSRSVSADELHRPKQCSEVDSVGDVKRRGSSERSSAGSNRSPLDEAIVAAKDQY